MTAIELKNVSKKYRRNITAVKDLNADIREGEVFGFLGPNGAGKSTTIDMIMGYARPTSGKITVMSYDTQTETKKVHNKVGILPDDYGLYKRLTGLEHLKFAIDMKNAEDNPLDIIDQVGLSKSNAKRSVNEFSTGMRQRLALGMAIVGSPSLIILDEPSKGLDPNGIRRVREIIDENKRKGNTVFFSSHLLSQVEAVCDRVGIIKNGKLLSITTVEELREDLGSAEKLLIELKRPPKNEKELLTDIRGISDVRTEDNILEISFTDSRDKIRAIRRIAKFENQIVDIKSEEPSLEDLFAAYT